MTQPVLSKSTTDVPWKQVQLASAFLFTVTAIACAIILATQGGGLPALIVGNSSRHFLVAFAIASAIRNKRSPSPPSKVDVAESVIAEPLPEESVASLMSDGRSFNTPPETLEKSSVYESINEADFDTFGDDVSVKQNVRITTIEEGKTHIVQPLLELSAHFLKALVAANAHKMGVKNIAGKLDTIDASIREVEKTLFGVIETPKSTFKVMLSHYFMEYTRNGALRRLTTAYNFGNWIKFNEVIEKEFDYYTRALDLTQVETAVKEGNLETFKTLCTERLGIYDPELERMGGKLIGYLFEKAGDKGIKKLINQHLTTRLSTWSITSVTLQSFLQGLINTFYDEKETFFKDLHDEFMQYALFNGAHDDTMEDWRKNVIAGYLKSVARGMAVFRYYYDEDADQKTKIDTLFWHSESDDCETEDEDLKLQHEQLIATQLKINEGRKRKVALLVRQEGDDALFEDIKKRAEDINPNRTKDCDTIKKSEAIEKLARELVKTIDVIPCSKGKSTVTSVKGGEKWFGVTARMSLAAAGPIVSVVTKLFPYVLGPLKLYMELPGFGEFKGAIVNLLQLVIYPVYDGFIYKGSKFREPFKEMMVGSLANTSERLTQVANERKVSWLSMIDEFTPLFTSLIDELSQDLPPRLVTKINASYRAELA